MPFPKEQNPLGEFVRQEDQFRNWVSHDGSSGYPAEANRYHLYVSLACPWAHRTIIIRKLKCLEEVIGMTVVDPIRNARGWAFRNGPGFSEDPVNDGVYRAGFAASQKAYDRAVIKLFDSLDEIEKRLSGRRYLVGHQLTEADWKLFTTLIRFDAVYYIHFKCNIRRIVDYKNLYGYLRDLYQHDGIAETVNFYHIKRHYFMTHEDINPTRIVPAGPQLDFSSPHG
ncbi:MAG: glutathione S-transferase C-terminal domain-containing protein, partial [Nitrospirae bacterium]|nr:glutathione S-transferase C-terminal domain-containing protein [Nitrospirota bacterium]